MSTLSRTTINGLQRLAERAGKTVAKRQPRTTVAARKQKLLTDLESWDPSQVKYLKREMAGYLRLLEVQLSEDGHPVLNDAGQYTLMAQALSTRTIKEFLEVVQSRIRDYAFAHMTATLEAQGVEDPENVNAEILVPSLGYRLSREGCGYTNPSINDALLKKALGNNWKDVYDVEDIPAQKVYTLNTERLWDLVKDDRRLMDKVRDAIIPGIPKPPRMNLRNI